MANLTDFAKRVLEQLARVNREPHWEQGEAHRYMAEVSVRRDRFVQTAMRLISTVIQPRLEILASHFSNGSPTRDEPAGRYSYWFGFSERFPASTKVAFAVEHDVRYEKVVICYQTVMVPVFIKLTEHDKLTLLLDEVKDDLVANWVEERLLEFLDAYLQLDRGGDDFGDEAATDPVCGMRINRSSALASDSFCGHPYIFCSRECQETFATNPKAYVEVKAM